MAVQTNWTHGGLLKTAGIAPAAYGMRIYENAQLSERILPFVDKYDSVENGEDLFIPVVGRQTAVTRYAKTTTDGSTYTKTTDNQGQSLTFAAISDSAVQFQEKFQYVALAQDKVAWNRTPQARRTAFLGAWRRQVEKALARAKDASVLSLANPGLIPSANQLNNDAPADISDADLGTILQLFTANLHSGPIVGVLHTSQISVCRTVLKEVYQWNYTGQAGGLPSDLVFRHGPLTIMFHPDVYDDDANGSYHGIFFVPGAGGSIAYRDVVGMQVDDWYDEDTKSHKTSPDTDYCYTITDSSLVVTIETPQAA